MIEVILKIIAAFFCIVGLAEILHALKQFLLKPKKYPQIKAAVYLSDSPIEELSSILDEYKWSKTVKAQSLTVICDDISQEDYFECEKIAEKYGVEIQRKLNV